MNSGNIFRHFTNPPENYNIVCKDLTTSTNDDVKSLASDGGNWIVTAERQTSGRGRLGRSFSSEPGGLYLSVSFRPNREPEKTLPLTAFSALAVCDAIEEIYGIRPDIKWPNDVLLRGKKICGILTEGIHTGEGFFTVTGIGINMSNPIPPELDSAGSLLELTGVSVEPEQLAAGLIERLLRTYGEALDGNAALLERYAGDCVTIGNEVTVCGVSPHTMRAPNQPEYLSGRPRLPPEYNEAIVKGTAIGIDENAALLVRTEDGRVVTVSSGEAACRR